VRPIWRSIALTSGVRVYGLVLSMVLLVFTARWLGPEGRGIVSSAVSWYSLLVTLGSLSLGQVVMHIAAREPDRSWVGPATGTLLMLAGGVTLGAWLLTGILRAFGAPAALVGVPVPAMAMAAALVPFLIWEQYGSALLVATGRLSTYNLALVGGRSAALLMAVALIGVAGLGPVGALGAMVAGQAVVAGVGMLSLARAAPTPIVPSRAMSRELLGGGARLHLNAIGTSWVSAANVLLIQQHWGAHASGIYTTAADLMGVLLVVAQATAIVLFGQLVTEGVDGSWDKHLHVIVWLTCLMAVASLCAAVVAPWVVAPVLGERFREVVPVWRVLLLGVAPQTVAVLMAPQWVARGRFLEATALAVGVGLLTVACNAWLVPRAGILAAAWVTAASNLALLVANVAFAVHISRSVRRAGEAPRG
jgi:O-antigen/teichoic acid export membrane protein